jgi:hypothetical protein
VTELTRRQMRELERSGQSLPQATVAQQTTLLKEGSSRQDAQPEALSAPLITAVAPNLEVPLTRREMRLRESGQPAKRDSSQTINVLSERPKPVTPPVLEVTVASPDAPTGFEAKVALPSGVGSPLPPIGPSRRERARALRSVELSPEIQPVQVEGLEIPEQGLMGANYLGEPTTQSIVLDVAPEAISLPVDTGEIFTTGSIAILPDATGSTTGSLDGIDLDTDDAVTGVISVVDPISARDLIDERSPLGVVPSGLLRKGWWRPWVVGALSVLMALAAILASITIFNSIGG